MTVRIDLTDTTKLWTEAYSEFGENNHQFGPLGDGFPETYAYIQITRVGDAEVLPANFAQDIVSFAVDQAVSYYGVGNDRLGQAAAADGAVVIGKAAGSDTAQTVSDFRYTAGELGINEDAPEDNQGPLISLFMNDESFVYGGITDNNPIEP